ncbi:unnamed protein product [Ilex paraguariensis]|uniref:Serine/threonine-protein phosphatase n=1 Tax=Ilex paraguariensis TaxID=185542 RepID=A0ABC8UUB8_9AQUA
MQIKAATQRCLVTRQSTTSTWIYCAIGSADGDYVDRGQHSLETISLLLALKVEYPQNVHLIRGNHEAADINALFGFRIECIERMGERDGIWAWHRINRLFNWLPLAALIEKKIICMHGGIGRSINHVEQIENLQRPITMEAGSIVLMDLLWSDPTENDSVEGLRPNARGPGLVTFGPDRVMEFCNNNDLQLIVRAHECVMDGFERFAQGHLITLFSATNYCGTANNAGAILVLGRDLVVVPKLIHPLPPAISSPEASPERHIEDTWMQELNANRPPTPTRGRPQIMEPRLFLYAPLLQACANTWNIGIFHSMDKPTEDEDPEFESHISKGWQVEVTVLFVFPVGWVVLGTANNAGAILVLGRDLVVVPKLIHPLPPAISSPEASPERHIEDTWMQELNANRPPTPTRGRPQVTNDRGSLAWI